MTRYPWYFWLAVPPAVAVFVVAAANPRPVDHWTFCVWVAATITWCGFAASEDKGKKR